MLTVSTTVAPTSEIRHLPWGSDRYTSGTSPTIYRFTGQRQESSLWLYFYGARWYDSVLGRWLSPDSIVPAQQGVMGNDRYAYTNNNPLSFTDPTGHSVVCGLGKEGCENQTAFDKQSTAAKGISKNSGPYYSYYSTNSIFLDPMPGASYGIRAENNWTDFYGSGDSGIGLVGLPDLINDGLEWIGGNVPYREMAGVEPNISGEVLGYNDGGFLTLYGVSVGGPSGLTIGSVSADVYNPLLGDYPVSSQFTPIYAASSYSPFINLPKQNTPIPPIVMLSGEYAIVNINVFNNITNQFGTITANIFK